MKVTVVTKTGEILVLRNICKIAQLNPDCIDQKIMFSTPTSRKNPFVNVLDVEHLLVSMEGVSCNE